MPKQPDVSVVLWIPGVKDRTLRAYYLCKPILGQPSVFLSESLYHMLVRCQHASIKEMRDRFVDEVKNLCRLDADPQSPEPPEFTNSYFGRSEMGAVMMLCTTAIGFPPDLPSFLRVSWSKKVFGNLYQKRRLKWRKK